MAGQNITTNTAGGYASVPELSDILRFEVAKLNQFRQLCDAKDAKFDGKGHGYVYFWDTFSNLQTQGGVVLESAFIPNTQSTMAQYKVQLAEYGNSVTLTSMVQDFSQLNMRAAVESRLKVDCAQTLDYAAWAAFDSTQLWITPVGGNSQTAVELSTTGSTTTVNNTPLLLAHLLTIQDNIMRERNVPPYTEMGEYIAIARPGTFRALKNDITQLWKYSEQGFNLILKGEEGKIEKMKIVYQTNILSAGWSAGQSDQAYFCGGDTVVEAIGIPEEIREGVPLDFGRKLSLAWYYVGAFALTQQDPAQGRVFKWASAS